LKIRQHEKDPQEKSGFLAKRGARAYEGALEAVLTIPIGLGLGYLADRYFGTEPVFLLLGLALGFASFVVRISRLRALIEETSEDGSEPPSES
jgi:F0F1-type ATP synthase assembly protein I